MRSSYCRGYYFFWEVPLTTSPKIGEESLGHEPTQRQIPYQISQKRPRVRRPLYLVLGSYRGTQRGWRRKALAKVTGTKGQPPVKHRWQDQDPSDLCHFWRVAPCKVQWQELGVPTAVLPETNIQIPKGGQEEQAQVEDKKQLNCVHTINLQDINSVLFPILGVSGFPTAGRLPHCSHNWQRITANQWVLQVV